MGVIRQANPNHIKGDLREYLDIVFNRPLSSGLVTGVEETNMHIQALVSKIDDADIRHFSIYQPPPFFHKNQSSVCQWSSS